MTTGPKSAGRAFEGGVRPKILCETLAVLRQREPTSPHGQRIGLLSHSEAGGVHTAILIGIHFDVPPSRGRSPKRQGRVSIRLERCAM
jgi:hypothetical protein